MIPLDGAGAGGVLSMLLHTFRILYALTSMVSQQGDQSVFVEAHSAGQWPCVQSRRTWKSSLHQKNEELGKLRFGIKFTKLTFLLASNLFSSFSIYNPGA